MNSGPIEFSIVLPCYNEAESLPGLLNRYSEIWEALPAELVLVNNGSGDNTAEVLDRILGRPEFRFARVVTIERNQGYGHGIWTGLQASRGRYVGYSHADLQCDPADLFRAYHRLLSEPAPHNAIVKGNRARRDFSASLITNGMTVLASTILLTKLHDINAQPKVFHRSFLEKLPNPASGFQFDLYLLYRARQNRLTILTIPVVFGLRAHGTSRLTPNPWARYRTMWNTIVYMFHLRFNERKEKT